MSKLLRIVCVLGALAAWAAGAHAFDATGTWEGRFSCRHFDGAKFRFEMKSSTLRVSQSGSTLNVDLDGGGFRYHGRAIEDDKSPDEKGEVLLAQCGTDDVAGTGFAEMLRAVVKTRPSKGTGTSRGVSIFEGDFGGDRQFGTCKYRFKRTSSADPNAQPCP